MEGELNDLHWFKSSASASGACVEVAHLPGGDVAVRDSKDRAKAPHVYTRREWEAFLTGAKNGEFDLPVALADGASPGSLGSPGERLQRVPALSGSPSPGDGRDERGPLLSPEQQRGARWVPRVPDDHAPGSEARHLHAVAPRGPAAGALYPAGVGQAGRVTHRVPPPDP
jgi:Domain of unknown function (DUF397)